MEGWRPFYAPLIPLGYWSLGSGQSQKAKPPGKCLNFNISSASTTLSKIMSNILAEWTK